MRRRNEMDALGTVPWQGASKAEYLNVVLVLQRRKKKKKMNKRQWMRHQTYP